MLSLFMINMLELSNFEFNVVTWITLDVFQDQRRGKQNGAGELLSMTTRHAWVIRTVNYFTVG